MILLLVVDSVHAGLELGQVGAYFVQFVCVRRDLLIIDFRQLNSMIYLTLHFFEADLELLVHGGLHELLTLSQGLVLI